MAAGNGDGGGHHTASVEARAQALAERLDAVMDGEEGRVCIGALWRLLAREYAVLALTAGRSDERAGDALTGDAADAATEAVRLVKERREETDGG